MTQEIGLTSGYQFTPGEWVYLESKKNIVAEVVDTKGDQLKVRMISPSKGKIRYTTFSTYFTMPIPAEEKEKIEKILGIPTVIKLPTKQLADESTVELVNEFEQSEPKEQTTEGVNEDLGTKPIAEEHVLEEVPTPAAVHSDIEENKPLPIEVENNQDFNEELFDAAFTDSEFHLDGDGQLSLF